MYKTCLISLIGLQWANKQIHHVVETNYYMCITQCGEFITNNRTFDFKLHFTFYRFLPHISTKKTMCLTLHNPPENS